MNDFKTISGLKGFCYYDVDDNFRMNWHEHDQFFRKEIFDKKVEWLGKSIQDRFNEDQSQADFDSGVVCARESFEVATGKVTSMECFIAPYKLMKTTIGKLSRELVKNESQKTRLRKNSRNIELKDGIAVAIGMVLAIIAEKGSVEKGNSCPYIIMIKRQNVSIRDNQLDAPVVEGLNINDFSEGISGKEVLDKIAKRAMEEERGINCEMLNNRGLLQMPSKYYLGYDEEYHQWNFFGTIKIKCTVEELVRQGYYFTKDKFETKQIIGIPFDPKQLSYILSFENKIGKEYVKDIFVDNEGMWSTGWASIAFAIMDYYSKKKSKVMKSCYKINDYPLKLKYDFRKGLNTFSGWIAKWERRWNNISASLAIALMICTVIWLFFWIVPNMFSASSFLHRWSDVLTVIVTLLSSVVALFTCCTVVACSRDKLIDNRGLIVLDTYEGNNSPSTQPFQEISVFRNVKLIDGNIAERQRKVTFLCKDSDKNGGMIKVNRNCKLFYDDRDKNRAWLMKADDEPDRSIENFRWEILRSDMCDKTIRIVIPCILGRQNILFKRDSNGKLMHGIDFNIKYKDLKTETDCEKQIRERIYEYSRTYISNQKVSFRFLLNAENQFTIIGFLDIEQYYGSYDIYALSTNLGNSSFSDDFLLDDITRVACEYAYVEYMGYAISHR